MASVIQKCRSCQADIVFLPTKNGKSMPVNAETVETDDAVFNAAKHVSHFATCTDPNKHRKPR